jgi:PAS domain-containing protein
MILYELFSNIRDPVLITNREYENPKVIYINAVFTESFGFSKRDILGQTPKVLQGPKTDRRVLDKIKQFLKDCCEGKLGNGYKITVELINYDKMGAEYWNELTIVNVKTESESVFLSFSRLANSRSELELALTTTEGDYTNPILFISWSIADNWNITAVSKSCHQLLGYEQLDLINRSFKTLVNPEDYKNVYRNSSKKFWEQRLTLLGFSGNKKTFNSNFYKTDKTVWGIFLEEFKIATIIYGLIQYLPGAFAIVSYSKRDRGPVIKVSNNQFKNLFGTDKDGKPLSELFGNNLSSVASRLFLNGVTQINQEFPFNGLILDVLFSVVDNPNESRLLIVRVRDRTDYKKALAESEALKAKIKEMQTLLEQSEHSDRSKLEGVKNVVGSVNINDLETFYKTVYDQLARFSSGLDSLSSQNSLMYKLLNDKNKGLPGINSKLAEVENKKSLLEKTLNGLGEVIKEHPKLFIYGMLTIVGAAKAVSMSDLSGFLESLENLLKGGIDE